MKRFIIGLTALFMLVGRTMAQKVSVADVEAVPGETVSFSLSLSEGRADSYTALGFDVQFPVEEFNTTGAYSVSSAWPDATAVIGDVDGTGIATIPFASANVIIGSEVNDLLTVSFKVDESVPVGNYDVTLKNIIFEYGGMEALKDYAPDATYTVKVVKTHVIVLDENSTDAPEAAKDIKIQVNRTINADEWSTICLPFAMTEEQVKECFGDDAQLADFTSWSSKRDGTGAIVGINVYFETVTAIEANHPYIITVSAPITEFTVSGVTLEPEEVPVVQVGKKASERGWFRGTYTVMQVPEENLFLSGNKFRYSTGNTTINGYRGYFEFRDVLDAYYDGTETKVNLFIDDEPGSSYLLGDVNDDGVVDLSDAIMVTYYSLHVVPASFNASAADMNGDGQIDLSDAIIIIYKSLGVK